MNLFDAFSGWMTANEEKKISKMQSEGKCPECKGLGTNALLFNDYIGMSYTGISFMGASQDDYDCPGCKGSGFFEDWSSAR